MARGLSRRERRFLAVGAAALLLFAAGRQAVRRGVDLGSRPAAQLEEKLSVLAAYRGALAREASLRREAELLDRGVAAYEEAFLPGDTPPLAAANLQTRLKEIAERSGMKIQSEKILANERHEPFLEVPVQVVASGDIRNLSDFLVAVERSPVFIAIREMTVRTIKRRQFVPETRTYAEINDIQASVTFYGLVRG